METNWYALAVQPRKERYVSMQLSAKGYSFRCPQYVKTIKHARRTTRAAYPLFPGYIFVALNLEASNWRQVNWMAGSIGLLGESNRPSPLTVQFVKEFVLNTNPDGSVVFAQQLKRGDRVQAVGGPFDRRIGEVIELADNERVKILLEAINRRVETTLPRKAVVVAA